MPQQTREPELKVFDDPDGVSRAAAGRVAWLARAAVGARGLFTLAPATLCAGVEESRDYPGLPGRIYESAREGRCPQCVEAFDLFVSAYGSEAGNLALRALATAGVYVGGGIAPKILPALTSGLFLEAFRAKEPMADLVATIPVSVILNPDSGLLGAAVRAMALSPSR